MPLQILSIHLLLDDLTLGFDQDVPAPLIDVSVLRILLMRILQLVVLVLCACWRDLLQWAELTLPAIGPTTLTSNAAQLPLLSFISHRRSPTELHHPRGLIALLARWVVVGIEA